MLKGSWGRALRTLLMLLLLLPALQAAALSLGDMVVHSLPGEPLRAHIPITLYGDELLAELHITLATAEEYEQRHIPRAELLQGLRLALLDKGKGRVHLQLFAEQPWQGDAVQLLFMINWPTGQMEQQFKLAAVTPAEEATPVYAEVAQDDTLDEIAIRLSKGRNRSYLHMMYALFLANPDAFYRGNMNNLRTGRTLRVPTDEELYRLSDREVFAGIRQQYEQWQQLRESKQQRGTQAGEALTGMSTEQVSELDLSSNPAALQQRLQQVAAESEAILKENEELRQRLHALEQRMQNVAGQVLDYAEADVPVTKPLPVQQKAETEVETLPDKDDESEAGLSAWAMFLAIILVLLFAFYIWYSTSHLQRERL
jgi:pilus assembly protein FimV